MNQRFSWCIAIGFCLAAWIACDQVSSAQGAAEEIHVTGPRLLRSVVEELEKRLQRAITYEDPIRVDQSDFSVVTINGRSGPKLREGAFAFTFQRPTTNSDGAINGAAAAASARETCLRFCDPSWLSFLFTVRFRGALPSLTPSNL